MGYNLIAKETRMSFFFVFDTGKTFQNNIIYAIIHIEKTVGGVLCWKGVFQCVDSM